MIYGHALAKCGLVSRDFYPLCLSYDQRIHGHRAWTAIGDRDRVFAWNQTRHFTNRLLRLA